MSAMDRAVPRDRRFAAWIATTLVLFVAAVAVGFVWLPSVNRGGAAPDLWGAICRAIGVPGAAARSAAMVAGQPASTLAWTPATRLRMTEGNAVRGATLATTCNNCHGATGVSADAVFPNLAGQSVQSLYKQLDDFRSGKRNAQVMGVFIATLSPQDLLDVASHFAALPNPGRASQHDNELRHAAARQLAELGSPARGIAPCAACHGPMGVTVGAPALLGQQRGYLEQQLQDFATEARHNDISAQMRSVARRLSAAEIAGLAAYYSSIAASSGR